MSKAEWTDHVSGLASWVTRVLVGHFQAVYAATAATTGASMQN